MVKLRKTLPELIYGEYKLLDEDNKNIYAFTRTFGNKKILVILNFSKKNVMFDLSSSIGIVKTVLINNFNNYKIANNSIDLKPYQAMIIRLK